MDRLPTDIALSNGSVAENQPGGTVVGVLSTADCGVGKGTAVFSRSGDSLKPGSIVRLGGLQYLHDPRMGHGSGSSLV